MSLRVFLLCAAVVVFLFLKLSLRFDQVELNVYHSYVESFISDGDLNIADEMLPVYVAQNRIPIVTPRNNDPDFHSYGATVAWSPFWLMGRGFAPLFTLSAGEINHSTMELSNQQRWTHSSLSISTFLFGVLVIIGLAYFLRENQLHWSGALVCLGTPFYYYWINNPGNPSIFATFVALVVWGWLWNWKGGDGKNFFFLGLLMGLGHAIKIELLFYWIAVIPLLIPLAWKEKFGRASLWILGILVVEGPMFINDYLKYGSIAIQRGYATTFNFDYNQIFSLLFSPMHGYLYVCPLIILAIIGVAFEIRGKHPKRVLLVFFLLIPFVKLLVESWTFSSGVDFGARAYLSEIPLLVFGISSLIKRFKNKRMIYSIVSLSILWTAANNLVYQNAVRNREFSYYIQFMGEHFVDGLKYFLLFFVDFEYLSIKGPVLLVLVLGILLIALHIVFRKRWRWCLVVYVTLFYVMTGFNIVCNKGEQFDRDVIVGRGPHIFSFFENMGSMNEKRHYYLNTSKYEKARTMQELMDEYYKKSYNEVLENKNLLIRNYRAL